MSHVDFYFDFSSPFAYLGSTQIEKVAERAGATMNWKPMFQSRGHTHGALL